MAATTGFQAAPNTNDMVISYISEAAWATNPATAFQAIRFTSETLGGTKKRDRPAEAGQWEASAAVTTEEMAGGNIAFALSYGTYDDFIASAVNNDWQAAQVINAITTDLTITTTTGVMTSTLSTKFSTLSVGQWIRLIGFTNSINNGIFRITAKASNQNITLSLPTTAAGVVGNFVTETSSGATQGIRASTLTNSSVFKSMFIQKKLAASQYLRYAGASVSNMSLTGGVGQFLSGSFDLGAQAETKATTGADNGTVTAAPTGRIHDPVTNFVGVLWNNVLVDATVDSFTITCADEGQGMQYGMGSATAVGVTLGKILVTGQLKLFFKNFTYYDLFKAETAGVLTVITKDAAGSAYAITLEACNLMNPKVNAGGPTQPVYASFDLEGNPLAAGGTIRVDRLAAT